MNEKNGKSVLVRADGIQVQAWGKCAEEAGLSMNAWIKGVCDRASGLEVGDVAEKVSPAKQSGGKKPREKVAGKVGRGVASAPVKMLNGYSQESEGTRMAAQVRSECNGLSRADREELGMMGKAMIESAQEIRRGLSEAGRGEVSSVATVQEPVLADWCILCLGRHGDLPVREGEPMELNGVKGWLCRWCLSGREPGQEKSIEDVVQESMGVKIPGSAEGHAEAVNRREGMTFKHAAGVMKNYMLDRERKFVPEGGGQEMVKTGETTVKQEVLPGGESASGLLPDPAVLSKEQKQVVFDQLKAQFGQAKLTDISDYPEKITPAHFETTAENPHNLPAIAEVVEQCPF